MAYSKIYNYTDGACFWECNEHITESVEVTNHGVRSVVTLRYLRVEYWSTEDATSKYVYLAE